MTRTLSVLGLLLVGCSAQDYVKVDGSTLFRGEASSKINGDMQVETNFFDYASDRRVSSLKSYIELLDQTPAQVFFDEYTTVTLDGLHEGEPVQGVLTDVTGTIRVERDWDIERFDVEMSGFIDDTVVEFAFRHSIQLDCGILC